MFHSLDEQLIVVGDGRPPNGTACFSMPARLS